MKVVFRNYFRNKMVNLTMKSIKHFIPESKFYCFTYYKNSFEEYNDQEKLESNIFNYYVKTKYVTNRSEHHDHVDVTKSSGYGNPMNGYYFAESFNEIYKMFKHNDEKILMLCEDHFFTTGKVLQELTQNEFDIAYGPTETLNHANACILAVNFKRAEKYFPLPEIRDPIELLLSHNLIGPAKNDGLNVYEIKNRKWIDYCGDGLYTNSSEVMREEMIKAGIL